MNKQNERWSDVYHWCNNNNRTSRNINAKRKGDHVRTTGDCGLWKM